MQGECFGLLGPNGAGKTSLVKILTGDQLASKGDGYVASEGKFHSVNESADTVYQILGYTPQFDALWDELTGREHLELFAAIKGASANSVTNVIQKMELEQYADKCAGTYSGGNKRKLSVAIALFSDPRLVFLDEPSTGSPHPRDMLPDAEQFAVHRVLLVVHRVLLVLLVLHRVLLVLLVVHRVLRTVQQFVLPVRSDTAVLAVGAF